jgi:hypothetical protein
MRSTIGRNRANSGAGLYNSGAVPVSLLNATVSGNQAVITGGGLINLGSLSLTFVTVASNTATVGGGLGNSGLINLTNSIIANNLAGNDCLGAVTSAGYNLDSDGSCALTGPGDIAAGNANLAPLQVNPPGSTETHALLSGSQAIDQIPSGANGCDTTIVTDQRGAIRPQPALGNCDMGAYEVP